MTTIRDIILHPTFTWSCVTKIIIDSFITAISDSVGAIVGYGNKDIRNLANIFRKKYMKCLKKKNMFLVKEVDWLNIGLQDCLDLGSGKIPSTKDSSTETFKESKTDSTQTFKRSKPAMLSKSNML